MFHLPALVLSEEFEIVALVDKSTPRTAHLAQRFGLNAALLEDHRALAGKAEAAVVATPNALHRGITRDLLAAGLHVLVEKPMALTVSDCDAMIEMAAQRVLCVGMVRRFYESSAFIRALLHAGSMGRVDKVDWREGSVFEWPGASAASFRRESSGGGVLVDVGVHVLDLLLWWLGDLETLRYLDDAQGGVEAECEVTLESREGALVTVELSRTRNLRNTCVIQADRGTLTFDTDADAAMRLEIAGASGQLTGRVAQPGHSDSPFRTAFTKQFADFAASIRSGSSPIVSGEQGKRSLKLIDRCYEIREPLRLPWMFGEEEGIATV
jgi:predicted dehydrogenase